MPCWSRTVQGGGGRTVGEEGGVRVVSGQAGGSPGQKFVLITHP